MYSLKTLSFEKTLGNLPWLFFFITKKIILSDISGLNERKDLITIGLTPKPSDGSLTLQFQGLVAMCYID